jgi:hypothetical protein
MRTTFFTLFYLLLTGVLALSACNMPSSNATEQVITPTDQAVITVSPTIDAAATQTRQAELAPTETHTVTPTETPVPEPSATHTPEPPVAEVVRETNCRVGPAGNYDLVSTYQPGQRLEVVAKDLGAGYWVVKNPEIPEEQCYLLAQNITINGDTSALPKFTPLPSPTAAPYFNVSFRKFDTCEGEDFALFNVENAGSIPFRSYYIRVTDQKAGKTVEQVLNAFDLRVRCVLAKNIAPLNPGEAGYVYSPQFTWNATSNKLTAVIMICTEKDLKGTCVTRTVEVNP